MYSKIRLYMTKDFDHIVFTIMLFHQEDTLTCLLQRAAASCRPLPQRGAWPWQSAPSPCAQSPCPQWWSASSSGPPQSQSPQDESSAVLWQPAARRPAAPRLSVRVRVYWHSQMPLNSKIYVEVWSYSKTFLYLKQQANLHNRLCNQRFIM